MAPIVCEETMVEPDFQLDARNLEDLIADLDSITRGDGAMYALIATGQRAIPALECYLVHGRPRSLPEGRCKAVNALGRLHARESLLLYLQAYKPPVDAVVLFAEDAVRSAVAKELSVWKSTPVYQALLHAAEERATPGLIRSIGEFENPTSLHLLFRCLEDDICREEAEDAIRRVPVEGCAFALAYLHERTGLEIHGPTSRRRIRATLELLQEWGVADSEWPWIRPFLQSPDASVVLRTVEIGMEHAPEEELPILCSRLLEVADNLTWLEEAEALHTLRKHLRIAQAAARHAIAIRAERGERPVWISRAWRILDSVLENEISHPETRMKQKVLQRRWK